MTASRLTRHEAFHSTWLDRARDITIYEPPPGVEIPASGLSCLFLHDGQNLFDPDRAHWPGHHWRVRETVDALILAGRLPPLVIVGMDHAGEDRIREYTPTPGPEPGAGLATRHARFVVDELLPFVRERHPISEDPALIGLGGSSMGALATLYVAAVEPGRFGRLLVMSPSVWWDRRVILRELQRRPLGRDTRVWLDIGRDEGLRAVSDARRLRELLRRRVDLRYVEDPDGAHSEDSWAKRFGDAVEFLFA